MTMLARLGASATEIEQFCKTAGRLTISHVVDKVIVKEMLAGNGNSRVRNYTIDLLFYAPEQYRAEYVVEPKEILAAFGAKFPLLLKKEIINELKKLDKDLKTQMAEVGKGRATRHAQATSGEPEEDGDDHRKSRDDDETSEVGDGDAFAAKRQRQAKEQTTYDDDEEDEESEVEPDDPLEVASALSSGADGDDDASELVEEDAELSAQVDAVEQSFLEYLPHSTSFSFRDSGCTIGLEVCIGIVYPCTPVIHRPASLDLTCRNSYSLALLRRHAYERSFVKYRGSRIASRARTMWTARPSIEFVVNILPQFAPFTDNLGTQLTTNGSNIPGLWHFACSDEENLIDENSVYSNDIFAVLCAYGVEAARTTILREIGGVFDVYKIDVDARHLELIADYMVGFPSRCHMHV